MERNNITHLKNKVKSINRNLKLVGFEDIEGNPDSSITKTLTRETLNIGLFHSPVYFKEVQANLQLSLASHSHGGQIRLPFIGAIWLPNGVDNYIEGWYRKNQSEL